MTLSLIIPIYNAAPYLRRCLDSVLAQTYTDFECLLVDDGSTDESLQICLEYAAQAPHFQVFHKENGGVADARNFGVSQAHGEYICWLDADDALLPNYLEELFLDSQLSSSADFVMQGLIRNQNNKEIEVLPSSQLIIYHLPEDSQVLFSDVNIRDFGVSVSKLFRRQLIVESNLVYHNTLIVAEDLDFLLRYLSFCKEAVISTRCNYIYYIQPSSVSNSVYSFRQEMSGLIQLTSSWQYICEKFGTIKSMEYQSNSCLAEYVHRVVISNYGIQLTRQLRLQNLRSISDCYLSLYGRYFHPTLFLRLVSTLLGAKCYFLADFLLLLRLG